MVKKPQKTAWMLLALLFMVVPCDAVSPGEPTDDRAAAIDGGMGGKTVVHLYFGDLLQPPYLRAETRPVGRSEDPAVFGKNILAALAEGPAGDFTPVVPRGTRVRAFFLDNDGTGYADLNIAARENHPGGSDAEIQTIYAVVNTLVLNVPGVRRVQILIEGEASETLAGHMCLDRPYPPNMLLIR